MKPAHYLMNRCWLLAAVCWLTAALLRWGAAPAFEKLPADYVAETSYAATLRSRQTPSGPVEETQSIVRRRDQTLTGGEEDSIIQGDAHWLTKAGAVIFETLNIYGVDRRTRQNLAGYGNEERTGQYLFPPHVEKKTYGLWDPNYAGPSAVTFERVEQFHGVEVYVFNSVVNGLDESVGYAALPEVPEKYRALTYGHGRFWIEPVSGVVVDHEDNGVSYFVEPKTGAHVGELLNQWTERFTPETIAAQLRLATTTRRKMLALELWLPLAFAAAGVLAAGRCLRRGGGR
jgi:hypothetical protein